MAYKRYIKKNGKVYGPYIYHSRKVKGKVISEYRGKGSVNKKNFNFRLIIFMLIVFLSLILILNYNNFNSTGNIEFASSISNIVSSSLISIKTMTGFLVSDAEELEKEIDANLEDEPVIEEAEEQVKEPVEEELTESIEEPAEEESMEQNETEEITNESQLEIIDEIQNETIPEPILNETIIENKTQEKNETISANITIENQTIISNLTLNKTINETILDTEVIENITKIANETIPESNLTNVTDINKTISKIINITETNITIVTTQYSAVIGKPVKWKKTVSLEEPENLIVKLPAGSKNINIKKINEEEIITSKITGQVIGGESEGFLSRFFKKLFRLTGWVIGEEKEIKVELNGSATEYEIEYETPAPEAFEEIIEKGKKITITGPETVHYENVLAFTDLPKESSKNTIKLYRTTGGIREQVEIINYTDTNNNSLIDYVEWIVPHLSEQTFEIITEITKAEHLDNNRDFISNIYEEVYQLDDIWSEEILSNDYVRVTFEIALDSTKDITVYPRIINGTPRIEVYEVDGTEIIAEFTNIQNNQYNKVLLTNLQGSQDIFDLRIVNGSLEFDYIIDPASSYNISFVAPTPDNGTTTTNTSIEINVSITNADDLNEVIFNWDGTNYTMYNDSLVLMMNFDNVSALSENDTYIVDMSKYGNNGTCSGSLCPTWNTSGKFNGAFEFDGINDWINFSRVNLATDNGTYNTLIFWMYWKGGDGETPIAWGDYYDLWIRTSIPNCIGFNTLNGDLYGFGPPAPDLSNKWVHVTLVAYNGAYTGNSKIYINGVERTLSQCGGVAQSGTASNSITLGRLRDYDYFFNGAIDELRVWNRSLSADEIQQQYFSNLNKYDTDKWLLYVNQSKNSTAGLDNGTYTYQAFVGDNVGNLNQTDMRYVTIDVTSPIIQVQSPINTTYTTSIIWSMQQQMKQSQLGL